jgi:hypothetical protein
MAIKEVKQKSTFITGSSEVTSSVFYLDATREGEASSSFARADHISHKGYFSQHKALIYQIKALGDDVEELRRVATGSGELNVDGGSF